MVQSPTALLILHIIFAVLILGTSALLKFSRHGTEKENIDINFMGSTERWKQQDKYSSNLYIKLAVMTIIFQVVSYHIFTPSTSFITTMCIYSIGFIVTIFLNTIRLDKLQKGR